MDDKDFNLYRICTVEKNVALLALKDLFETLWEEKHPEIPWTKNAASVQLFEQKEYELFQKSIQALPNKEKGKRKEKRIQRQGSFRGSNWTNYQWDINKVVYALVDSKLFDLTIADENGMPVSEHITKIRDIRNLTAHLPTSALTTEEFERVLESTSNHIKALEITKLDVSQYIAKLQTIKSQEKPVLKHVYKERERHDALVKKQIADKDYFLAEYERLDREKHFLKKNIDQLNKKEEPHENEEISEENGNVENTKKTNYRHSVTTKYGNLKVDYSHLNKVTDDLDNKGSVEPEELKSENDYLEQIMVDINKTHSVEIDRLKSENDIMKQILTHSSELIKLKLTLADMKMKHEETVAKLLTEHSAEVEILMTENANLKQTINERNDQKQLGIQKNTNIYQLLICYHVCIFIVITFLSKVKNQGIK